MEDITISTENAFRQASITAADYLGKCLKVVGNKNLDYTIDEIHAASALAQVCAIDFQTTVIASKLQEIRDSIEELKEMMYTVE